MLGPISRAASHGCWGACEWGHGVHWPDCPQERNPVQGAVSERVSRSLALGRHRRVRVAHFPREACSVAELQTPLGLHLALEGPRSACRCLPTRAFQRSGHSLSLTCPLQEKPSCCWSVSLVSLGLGHSPDNQCPACLAPFSSRRRHKNNLSKCISDLPHLCSNTLCSSLLLQDKVLQHVLTWTPSAEVLLPLRAAFITGSWAALPLLPRAVVMLVRRPVLVSGLQETASPPGCAAVPRQGRPAVALLSG